MPIKIKDAEGNEHEVFTQADLDAALTAKVDEINATIDEKTKRPDPVVVPTATTTATDEKPAWAKEMEEKIDSLGGTVNSNVKSGYIKSVASGLDADKRKELETRFDGIQGYPDTPEGQTKRAEDAYLLVTGQPYNASVNLANLNNSGSGAPGAIPKAANSEVDKGLQEVMGIKQEDVDKFGKK